MGDVNFTLLPLYSGGHNPSTHYIGGYGEENNILHLPGIEPQILSHLDRSLVTISKKLYMVACRAVSRQRPGKHFLSATDALKNRGTVENGVFCSVVQRGYKVDN
jgi:hypothetical protein